MMATQKMMVAIRLLLKRFCTVQCSAGLEKKCVEKKLIISEENLFSLACCKTHPSVDTMLPIYMSFYVFKRQREERPVKQLKIYGVWDALLFPEVLLIKPICTARP